MNTEGDRLAQIRPEPVEFQGVHFLPDKMHERLLAEVGLWKRTAEGREKAKKLWFEKALERGEELREAKAEVAALGERVRVLTEALQAIGQSPKAACGWLEMHAPDIYVRLGVDLSADAQSIVQKCARAALAGTGAAQEPRPPLEDIEMMAVEAAYDILEIRKWDDDDLRQQVAGVIVEAIREALGVALPPPRPPQPHRRETR